MTKNPEVLAKIIESVMIANCYSYEYGVIKFTAIGLKNSCDQVVQLLNGPDNESKL